MEITSLKVLNRCTDEELVAAYRATGENRFLSELYRRYAHLGYGLGLKYMKNEEEARDALADAFTILVQRLKAMEGEVLSFRSYFYTVVKNECLGRLRRKKQEQAQNEAWQKQNADAAFVESEAIRTLIEQEEDVERLMAEVLETLKPKQRHCIRLFFFEQLSYQEISEQTGFTFKEVKTHLQNGKRNLKIRLAEKLNKAT